MMLRMLMALSNSSSVNADLRSGRGIPGNLRGVGVGFRPGPPDLHEDPAQQIQTRVGYLRETGVGNEDPNVVGDVVVGGPARVVRVREDITGRVIVARQGQLLIVGDVVLCDGSLLRVIRGAARGAQTQREQSQNAYQPNGDR